MSKIPHPFLPDETKYPAPCGCAGPLHISMCETHQQLDLDQHRRHLGIDAKPWTIQARAAAWATEAFGVAVVEDLQERALRFLEEALELAQAVGLPERKAIELQQKTYGREPGVVAQEVGGVVMTLAVLCHAVGISLVTATEEEYQRCLGAVEVIRVKQLEKVHP